MYILIILFVSLITLSIILNLKKYDSIRNLPGPSWLETFEFFFFKRTNEETYKYITSLPERYGSVAKLWLKPFKPVLVIADVKFFEHILTSREHVHKTVMYDLLHDLAGNGLVTNQDVPSWRQDRKLLSHAFNKRSISEYALSFTNHIDNIKREIELHENQPIDIQHLVHCNSLGIVMEYLIQERVDEDESYKMVAALDGYLDVFLQRVYSAYKRNDTIFRMWKGYKQMKETASHIDNAIDDILKKQILLRKTHTNSNGKKNFMDLLLNSGLDPDRIHSHLKTFVLAGYDTTAAVLTFALYELSRNPIMQEHIYREYLEIVGDDPNAEMNFAQIENMTYTGNCIKETLRIYPTVPIIQRKLRTPVKIGNITVPADIDLVFSIASLHNLYFDRPKEFDPDRFSPDNIRKITPYSYSPFSIGPRDCIGKRIGTVETKFLLASIVRHFTIHPAVPEHKVEVVGELTLKSKNGVIVIFRKRK